MKMLTSLLTATTALSLAATGCIQQDAAPSELGRAIPTNDQVAIKLPTANSGVRDAGIAPWYIATRDVTNLFNGGSAWVLVLVHTIVEFPVTSVSGNTYTWGPWTGSALDPANYKLDVTANADGTYDYVLSGQSKTLVGAAFESVIDGHADPRAGDLLGNGTFLLDFDAAKRVDPIDNANNAGQISATYDLATKHLALTITSTDAAGNPVNADYAYDQAADGGGDMTLQLNGDGTAQRSGENAVLRSRWTATGAGRADGRVTGGDLGALVVTESQCWDATFHESYYVDSVDFEPTSGDAASCAFADQDLPPQ